MELTRSWSTSLPAPVAERFELRETRNAAAVLAATCPAEFDEICAVLGGFALRTTDLIDPGGNESRLAARLNTAFRARGWREGRVDTVVTSRLQVQGWAPAGEHGVTVRESEVVNEGYKVDNVKGRVALDVEWNAKDGNLDRDVGAYRALYDAGLIDGAVVLTRTHDDLRELARDLARAAGRSDEQVRSRLSTSTTTHLGKLESRMSRGDAGGCPLLAVAISRRCWRAQDDETDPRPEAGEPPLMLIDGTTT
jgi:hypothetical protein